jgi:hypothetical protein
MKPPGTQSREHQRVDVATGRAFLTVRVTEAIGSLIGRPRRLWRAQFVSCAAAATVLRLVSKGAD